MCTKRISSKDNLSSINLKVDSKNSKLLIFSSCIEIHSHSVSLFTTIYNVKRMRWKKIWFHTQYVCMYNVYRLYKIKSSLNKLFCILFVIYYSYTKQHLQFFPCWEYHFFFKYSCKLLTKNCCKRGWRKHPVLCFRNPKKTVLVLYRLQGGICIVCEVVL